MNLLRIDSIGGASGDMLLSLLADLGADLNEISSQISKANPGAFVISSGKVEDKGISGTRVEVAVEEQHHHRHLKDILIIIEKSGLSARAKELASRTFDRLARAEGDVHGISKDHVHFHEVGALDSIVDILGACAGLCMLKIDAVTVGTLPTGTGTVQCAHGVMPVPAPATAELLIGHPVICSGEQGEMVTPTGAALLMEWKASLPLPSNSQYSMQLTAAGYGIGRRSMTRPNVIRGILLSDEACPTLSDECLELQTNVDDMSPEQAAYLQRRLLELGALDVFYAPVNMKKNRPGMLLTILCRPADRDPLQETVFRESTSLGIRESFKLRTILKRKIVEVETEFGRVRIKTGILGSDIVTSAPEYEDCARLASEKNVPFKKVYDAATRAFDSLQ